MNIAIVDIVFAGIIIIFTLRCAVKGVVSELMSLAALIFGLLSAIFFFRKAAIIVRERFMPGVKTLPEIISFVALFLIVFAAIKLVEVMLKGIIEGVRLSGPDHFLGFIFGLGEGVIVVCLLLFIITIQPFIFPEAILKGSFFAEFFLPFIMGTNREVKELIVILFSSGGYFCLV